MATPWERATYEHIEEICQAEAVADDSEPIAKTIAERYYDDGGSGKAPKTVAAVAVRLARGGKDWATQEEIAEIADVSVPAMTSAYDDLVEYADDLTP